MSSVSTQIHADWKPDPQATAFKVCKYMQSSWTRSISPSGHQSHVIQRSPLGGNCKNWGSRQVYKHLSGRPQRWLPYHMFPESTSVIPRCVPNLKPASQAEAPGQANSLPSQTDLGCFNVSGCCLCSALGWQPANNYLSYCYSCVGPRNTSPPGHQARRPRSIPCVAASNTRAPEEKPGKQM